jgi:hypothetical protein
VDPFPLPDAHEYADAELIPNPTAPESLSVQSEAPAQNPPAGQDVPVFHKSVSAGREGQAFFPINQKNESLITAIINMARSLGLEVVAEGVEKDEQLAFLRAQLCDGTQGFLLSHPLPGEELSKILGQLPDQAAP